MKAIAYLNTYGVHDYGTTVVRVTHNYTSSRLFVKSSDAYVNVISFL